MGPLLAQDQHECEGSVETALLTLSAQEDCRYARDAAAACLDATEQLECDGMTAEVLEGPCRGVYGPDCLSGVFDTGAP